MLPARGAVCSAVAARIRVRVNFCRHGRRDRTGMLSRLAPPEIRFCSSADGTRVAFASWGAGTSTVILAQLHLGEDLNAPGAITAHLIAALSQNARVICFDARGCGFSERSVDTDTPTASAED